MTTKRALATALTALAFALTSTPALAAGGNFNETAILDISQVEVGLPVEIWSPTPIAVDQMLDDAFNAAYDIGWLKIMLDQEDSIVIPGEVDGHAPCVAIVGDTSFVFCSDGYESTS